MMNLKLLLPFGVLKTETNVTSIVIETAMGCFGLLPHRLDCVAAIEPGILIYQYLDDENKQNKEAQEVYVAVDAGVLVKTGMNVTVSVRHAVVGSNLEKLRDTVEQTFLQESAQDQNVHSVFKKMQSDFIRRLAVFRHGE